MLLQTAGDGADLATPEGRARLLAQAAPLHALLPPGLLREQMLAEIAQAGGMAAEALARTWAGQQRSAPAGAGAGGGAGPGAAPARMAGPAGAPRTGLRRMSVAATSLLDRAAWLLLHEGGLWDGLSGAQHEQLAGQPQPYGAFFSWLERQVHEHGALTMNALLDLAQHADEPLPALVQRLSGLHALDAEINVATELAAVLHRLDLQQVDDELKLITESGELSDTTRQRYQALALRRALLKRGPV
jgi:DNA primase